MQTAYRCNRISTVGSVSENEELLVEFLSKKRKCALEEALMPEVGKELPRTSWKKVHSKVKKTRILQCCSRYQEQALARGDGIFIVWATWKQSSFALKVDVVGSFFISAQHTVSWKPSCDVSPGCVTNAWETAERLRVWQLQCWQENAPGRLSRPFSICEPVGRKCFLLSLNRSLGNGNVMKWKSFGFLKYVVSTYTPAMLFWHAV